MLNVLSRTAMHPTQYQAWKLHGQLKVCDSNTNMPFVSNGETGRERGALGSLASAALSYFEPIIGAHEKSFCLCTLHIMLHVLLLHVSTWPPHCCTTKAGSPPPGTCQHRSRHDPPALMLGDRRGTTRKWSTIVRLGYWPAWRGPHSGFWVSVTAASTELFVGHCVQIKMVGVLSYS